LHAGADLAEGKDFARFLGGYDVRAQTQDGRDCYEGEEQKAVRLGKMRLAREHELAMILGGVRVSNQTNGAERMGQRGWTY
jgi:hypothetical protein